MKKLLTLLAVMLFTAASWAQNADYLLKKDFQSEKKKMSEGIDVARKTGIDAKKIAARQVLLIDSLMKTTAANEKILVQTNDSMQKTSSRFNALEGNVDKSNLNTRNLLTGAIVVFAILFVLILVLVFFLRSKSDAKFRELAEENQKLGETVNKEIIRMKEELKKVSDSLMLTLHEYSANFAAKIEQCDEKQSVASNELREIANRIVKEQTAQKSAIDEQFKEFVSKVNADRTDHKTLHEKIESEVKGLRTLHIKDVEEIKAKL